MSRVLVVEHLISLNHATKVMRLFKQKKHKDAGYFFELTDLGVNIWHRSLRQRFPHLFDDEGVCKHLYADYGGTTNGYHLKVYRTLP
jgi:hypothetical protein